MTLTTTTVRTLGTLSAGMLALGMLAACTPAPEPEPTKTALFATDEEAFAAAEDTYRAYTDALNKVDTSDPKTFEPVFEWTVGRAHAAIRKSLSELHAESVTLTGSTVVTRATPISFTPAESTVRVHICADVSKTDVLDSNGSSLVPEGRAPIQSLLVDLTEADTDTGLAISSTEGDETHSCSP